MFFNFWSRSKGAEEKFWPQIDRGDFSKTKKDFPSNLEQFRENFKNFLEDIFDSCGAHGKKATVLVMLTKELLEAAKHIQEQRQEVESLEASLAEKIELIAAAAEEMATSVSEIANFTANTNHEAQQTKERAESASFSINELFEAVEKVKTAADVIRDLADQTNLLALNATIEAARAGEAGKGFAVVANEVKELSRQTASSVQKIEAVVKEITDKTLHAKEAISQILEGARRLAEMTNNVAAAVEEQTATTSEISANLQEIREEAKKLREFSKKVAEASFNVVNKAQGLNKEMANFEEVFFETQKKLEKLEM